MKKYTFALLCCLSLIGIYLFREYYLFLESTGSSDFRFDNLSFVIWSKPLALGLLAIFFSFLLDYMKEYKVLKWVFLGFIVVYIVLYQPLMKVLYGTLYPFGIFMGLYLYQMASILLKKDKES